jgi:pilus assembly protein CpaE
MRHPASGTLGNVQLLAFVNAASAEACQLAAKELGFAQVRVETGNVVKATEFLAQHPSPEILVVEIGSQDEAPAQLDALADMVNPHTKVLATGTVDSIRFFQWLSDLGIDGYLLQPFTAVELKQAIAKGSIKRAEAHKDKPAEEKKLVAVVGARGGVGTTTVAANLAAIFARDHHLTTALADLDPYFGCVALAMDLMPGRGLRDALEKPDRVDALFLERVMVKPFNQLSILSAEEALTETIAMQANAGEMMLAALREKFRVIVADVPRQMNPLTRHILSQADHVIIVAEPQVTALRDSLRFKDYLVDGLKRPTPLVVLNRVGLSSANEVSARDFEKNYGHAVSASLPFMHEAVAAGAQGELLNTVPKLSTVLNPLRGLAKHIVGEVENDEAASEKSGSILNRFLGKK